MTEANNARAYFRHIARQAREESAMNYGEAWWERFRRDNPELEGLPDSGSVLALELAMDFEGTRITINCVNRGELPESFGTYVLRYYRRNDQPVWVRLDSEAG